MTMKTYEELGLPPILGERAIVLNADGADNQGYQQKVGHTGTVKEINSEFVRLTFGTDIMYSFYRSEVGPVEQQSSQTKEKKTINKTTYPHNIQEINRVAINTATLKRCEGCPYGEKIHNLCGAHKCTVGIGETYSFNDGCNFAAMVKSEHHILLVSEHLRLAFSEMGEPESEVEEEVKPDNSQQWKKYSDTRLPKKGDKVKLLHWYTYRRNLNYDVYSTQLHHDMVGQEAIVSKTNPYESQECVRISQDGGNTSYTWPISALEYLKEEATDDLVGEMKSL